ncbi:MAG: anti-anti-sigma factor [Phenylobacterium sp.]|jgi:anti-anti-sigma factor
MSVTTHFDQSTLIIEVEGRFGFGLHQQFVTSFSEQTRPVDAYVVDLEKVSYIESSALGMLLVLRKFAAGVSSVVKIINPSSDVRRVLSIAHFEEVFDIEDDE